MNNRINPNETDVDVGCTCNDSVLDEHITNSVQSTPTKYDIANHKSDADNMLMIARIEISEIHVEEADRAYEKRSWVKARLQI